MVTIPITYTDYNGTERTEDFLFHYSKAELVEKELGVDGGLSGMIDRIIKAQSVPDLIKIFKELLLDAYGIKSLDGKRFEKSEEIKKSFEQSEAYSELFMKFATDDEEAAKFINALIPNDIKAEVEKQAHQEKANHQ